MVKKLFNFIKWIFSEQPTLGRLSLNKAFQEEITVLKPGKILEIGGSEAHSIKEFLDENCGYLSLNLLYSENIDIVGDACEMPLKDSSVNSIVMLEVLEHIPDFNRLKEECSRIIKKGGYLIGSTRFIYPEHGAPSDYFRFTEEAIRFLFQDFSVIKVKKLGNRLQVLFDILQENVRFTRAINRLIQHIPLKPKTCYSGLIFILQK